MPPTVLNSIENVLFRLKKHGSGLSSQARLGLRDDFHNLLAQEMRTQKIDEEEYRLLASEFLDLWKESEDAHSTEEELHPFWSTKKKQKILVLISEGGGGHKSAGESLQEVLGDFYDVEVINVLGDILQPLDSLSVLTKRSFSGEDLYNIFLRWGLHFVTRLYVHLGNFYMKKKKKKIAHLFARYLLSKNELPDLIISTIPIMNHGLILAAYQKKIPFLLLPTDLDTKLCLNGLKKLQLDDHRYFRLALPYDDPDVRIKVVKHSNVCAEQLEVTGFPVRKASRKKYTSEEILALRIKHGLLPGYETITLVFGAQGGETIFEHTKNVSTLSGLRLEANICVGRNEKIKKLLIDWLLQQEGKILQETPHCTTILSQAKVVLHVRGFTKEIIEIMACSKLLITKTGSCSVNEGIYLGVPLLLDNTRHSSARHFWWERFNIQFIQKLGLGDVFTKSKQLKALIPSMLAKDTPNAAPFFPPDFSKNILRLVSNMLNEV